MGQSNSRLFHYITQEAVAIRVNKEKLNSGDSLIPESNKTFKNSFFTDANRVKYKKMRLQNYLNITTVIYLTVRKKGLHAKQKCGSTEGR